MTPLKFTSRVIPRVSELVKGGGVIVFPTDTVYGIGCDPMNIDSVRRVFKAKQRESRPLPVLCDSLESARKLVTFNGTALDLARRFWPGALTIVAPLKTMVPFELHQGSNELGVRGPDYALCVELIRACGGCLTGTSANLSGERPFTTARSALLGIGTHMDLVLDGGELTGVPSTVVRVSGREIIVLRRGPVGVGD